MSTNDILRKYLDILNEAPEAPADITASPSDQISYAPPVGNGSIKKVIEAVKEFQASIGKEPTGIIDPPTLAELLSQSGTMAKDEMEKLKTGQEQPDTQASDAPIAESMGGGNKRDMLADKAALHMGYAHGLMGGSHDCSHPVGSSSHSHYCHGHNEGLKECGMMPSPTQAPAY
jgi:hypothetical protein